MCNHETLPADFHKLLFASQRASRGLPIAVSQCTSRDSFFQGFNVRIRQAGMCIHVDRGSLFYLKWVHEVCTPESPAKHVVWLNNQPCSVDLLLTHALAKTKFCRQPRISKSLVIHQDVLQSKLPQSHSQQFISRLANKRMRIGLEV